MIHRDEAVPRGAMPIALLVVLGFGIVCMVELFGIYMLITSGVNISGEAAPLWIAGSNIAGAIFAASAANMNVVLNYMFGSSASSRAKSLQASALEQVKAENSTTTTTTTPAPIQT